MNIEPALTAISPSNNNGGTEQSFNANGKRSLDEMEGGNAGSAGAAAGAAKPTSDPDVMRAYRACLHCRSRKTKCNLDANNGKPPCKRCQREDRECILGESHRGGRRIRKKPKIDDAGDTTMSNATPPKDAANPYQPPKRGSMAYDPIYSDNPQSWHSSIPASTSSMRSDSRQDTFHTPRSHDDVNTLQMNNPSDALGILARVADHAESGRALSGADDKALQRSWQLDPELSDEFVFPPLANGQMTEETIYDLFDAFERNYHSHFPIVSQDCFYRPRMKWMSRHQPHLFAAILCIGSRDDYALHMLCYNHLQVMIADVVCGGNAETEAIEALLLLSQYICHRPMPRGESQVGKGEEDRVAWMYIGLALRLGWYLGIDKAAYDVSDQSSTVCHNRLVWSACYLADRNVSIRIGKGFWARAPGPLLEEATNDFPTLMVQPGREQLGKSWQAQLRLTQLFTNVSDILYSTTTGASWKEMLDGRYAKHLDDFRVAIENWNTQWASIDCSDRLKAGLFMTYDYLRLYVNAFAYQANITRAMTRSRPNQNEPIPLLDASSPDSRFIYEAIDAAKSIVSRVNVSMSTETLRYMPCRYYLYVVYSSVFLYKARSTTMMTDAEREEIKVMVTTVSQRLKASSIGSNQVGARYARLLELLWNKTPSRSSTGSTPQPYQAIQPQLQHRDQRVIPNMNNTQSNLQPQQQDLIPLNDTSNISPMMNLQPNLTYDSTVANFDNFVMPPNNLSNAANLNGNSTFSWLDLNATWNYANNAVNQNYNPMDASGGIPMQGYGNISPGGGLDGMDLGVVGDFRNMKSGDYGLIF